MEEFLTIDELAKRLRVKKSWIYRYSRQSGPESIPKIKVGKYLRFRLNEVMKWVEGRQLEN